MNNLKSVFAFILAATAYQPAFSDWALEKDAPFEIVSSNDLFIVEKSGLYTAEKEIVYKILNEQGRNYLALKGIPFVPDATKIQVLRASTVTDDVETKVDLKSITVRQAKTGPEGLSSVQEMVIPFTNLQIGSLVKYKYRERQVKTLVNGFFSTAASFGITAPEAGGNLLVKSQIPLFIRSSDPWNALTIEQKKEGPYFIISVKQNKRLYKFPAEMHPILTKRNATGVDISSMESWRSYIGPIAERYEKILADKNFPTSLNKIVDKAAKQATTIQKIDMVTSELATIMTYSGNWTTFDKMFFPQKLSEIGKLKIGDCKDFSMATVAMLRKLGIKANIALTYRNSQTSLGAMRSEAIDDDMPQSNMFNHAIVKVQDQGKTYWIDPTNLVSSAGYIFSDIAGSHALEVVANAEKIEKIPYSGIEQNSIILEKEYIIKGDHTAETTSNFTINGDFSKAVIELSLTKNGESGQKILSALNRTSFDKAKARFENVDFKNRITQKISGVEKALGEKVLLEEEGKTYFSAPVSILMRASLVLGEKGRVTDANLGGNVQDKTILRVKGYDFVGYPEGCTIITPWFNASRKFIKIDQGFEILDHVRFLKNTITASDINTDKFQMALGDIYDCSKTQAVEVRQIKADETLVSRMAPYTFALAKEKYETQGPKSISGARESLHIIENLLVSSPKDKALLLLKAKTFRMVGYKSNRVDNSDYIDAGESILNVLVVDYPKDGEVWIQKTWNAFKRKDKAEIIKNFQNAHLFSEKNYSFYILGGTISEHLNNLDAAKGSYLKAVNLAKTPVEKSSAAVGLADILLRTRDVENGLAYYRQAISLNPDNAWVQGNFVSTLNDYKKWDEAIVLGEKAMKDGGYGVLRKTLAQSYNGKATEIYLTKASSVKGTERIALFGEIENTLMKGLKHDKSCGECLVTMGAIYRMMAFESKDKDLAQKALAYYEMAKSTNEVETSMFMQSQGELKNFIGDNRSPASVQTAVPTPQSPNGTAFDLQR